MKIPFSSFFYIKLTYHLSAQNFRQKLVVCYDLELRTNDSSSFLKNSIWIPPGILAKIISNSVVFMNKNGMNWHEACLDRKSTKEQAVNQIS